MRLISIVMAAFLASVFSTASAAPILVLSGYAGDLNAPSQDVGPEAASSISLDIPNALPGTRSATASGQVEAGIVRVSSATNVSAGTNSIGDLSSHMMGGWRDTLTIAAPGVVGGITITPGMSGQATFSVDISGTYGVNGSNAALRSAWDGRLWFDPDNCTSQSLCSAGGDGERDSLPEHMPSDISGRIAYANRFDCSLGELAPGGTLMLGLNPCTGGSVTLELVADIAFGEEFDLEFQLSSSTSLGFEGAAGMDLAAYALLSDTALWGGTSSVTAFVPDGSGGTINFVLPQSAVSVTSSTFDYTDPVSVVPLPASIWLLGTAIGGLAVRRRFRRTGLASPPCRLPPTGATRPSGCATTSPSSQS